MPGSSDDKLRCMYANSNGIPNLSPATPGTAAIAVPGHANVNEWGVWTTILGNAVIDAESGNYFDVTEININGLTANSFVYFEFQYDSLTIARGYINPSGTKFTLTKNQAFKMTVVKKVAGEDLKMRLMSDQAGDCVDAKPIMWVVELHDI